MTTNSGTTNAGSATKVATSVARKLRQLWPLRQFRQFGMTGTLATVVAVGLVSGAILIACSEDPHAEGPTTGAVCPTTSTLTYGNFGQAFMQSYCLRCHSSSLPKGSRGEAPEDHNFDMLVDIRVFKTHIDAWAGSGPSATNDLMPPDDPRPTTEERAKLAEWLACNAPM